MSLIQVWWANRKHLSEVHTAPWRLLFDRETLVHAKRFRVLDGEVRSATALAGDVPPAPGIDGWLEIKGRVEFEG